jgi:hypothetical protein
MGAPVTLTTPRLGNPAVDDRVSRSNPLPVFVTDGESSIAPIGYQQIVEPETSTGLIVPNGATFALIQNNGAQPARWRDDGPAPTTTMGLRIRAGDEREYRGNLSALKFIREAAGVTLDVNYYA